MIKNKENMVLREELKEPIDLTLGRLRGIMKMHDDQRGLAFVDKVIAYIDKVKPVRI